MVFFFVDDIVTIYDRRYKHKVDIFQNELFKAYDMRYLGELEWFLGIQITRDRPSRKLCLSQSSYIDKISKKFNIENCPKYGLIN